jgi:hypothetical protein
MKILFTIIFCLIPLTALSQHAIESYQYWFNNDTGSMTEGSAGQDSGVPVYSFSTSIGSDGLPDGLHVLNLRFRDSEKKWSPVLSWFFYRMPAAAATDVTIDRVSYWFNNNVAGATEEAVTGGGSFLFNPAIATDGLADGLHVLNMRFRDSEKKWSPVLSRFFYRMPAAAAGDNSIAIYSYWFNNDIVNAVEKAVPPSGSIAINEKFDAATLPDGLHVFNIRFKDTAGKWSGTLSRFFYRMPVQEPLEENLVKAYRYWFNEDDGRIFNIGLDVPVNPLHLVADIETPYLEPGGHTFHIQFLDLRGKWSPVLTSEFDTEECALPGYINDPAGPEEVCQGAVEIYTVQAALNIGEFEWSLTPAGAGTLEPDGSAVTVHWSEGFTGDAELVVYGSNPCGESETRSLTVTVVPEPYVTAMDNTSVCQGSSVLLEVLSSYGSLEWNVADLMVSPLQETTYTVTASTLCGVAEDQVIVGVGTPPYLTVMDDVAICAGEQVELTAASDGTVTWSGGNITVSPSRTTTYTATARQGACMVEGQVTVTVNPVPVLTVMDDFEICEGDQVELSAVTDGVLSWSSGSAVVAPSESITYTAFAEMDGCGLQDYVTVTVHRVPDTPALIQEDGILVSSAAENNIWFLEGAELENIQGREYTPEAGGDYFVRVVSASGCVSEPSNIVSFTVSNTLQIGMSKITVFPNPVNDLLYISPGLPHGEPFRLELLTLGGRVLIMRNITSESFINVAGLSPSVYILRISQGEESRVMRIIKN